MALKFAGRTPSSALRRSHHALTREQASRKSRAWAMRVGFVALLLWLCAVVAHAPIDALSSPTSSTRSTSSTIEVSQSPLFFVGEALRLSGLHGALFLLVALFVALTLWFVLSLLGEWHRPPLGLCLLIGLQLGGWAFHEANVRALVNNEYSMSAVSALHTSWEMLALSQKISFVVASLFGFSLLWFWGAGIEARAAKWSGPQKAQGFLRKRKTSFRLAGLTLMFFAFIATGVLGVLLFGKTLQLPVAPFFNFGVTPPISFVVCILLDAVYFHGRALWRRLN